MPRFMRDDKVTYTGEKFKQEYGGALGIVCAPVENNPEALVVDFGNDSIVVHVSKLAPFQGHLKSDEDDKKKKEPKVERRRRPRRDESEEE